MENKILVLASTFPRWKNDSEPGFVYFLSELLVKKGYDICVLVPHFPGAKKFEKMEGLEIHRFSYFYPESLQKLCYEGGILSNLKKSFFAKVQLPFFLFSELFGALRLARKERISLVHAHWIMPQGLIALILKKVYNLPYIVTAHGRDIFPLRSKVLKSLNRIVLKNCDYCTVNSNATKNAILSVYKVKNIKIIPMGVDLNSFNPNKRDDSLKKELGIEKEFILTVGRLAEEKGTKYLIEAMPSVLKEFPKAKLIVVGYGPEKESLEKLTGELNLRENVNFVGKILHEELPRYYATADLFVGPSIVAKSGSAEGLGVVFLESIASGTPVIGSNVGGIPDIIKNHETGILVKQKNSLRIAEGIIKLLKSKELSRYLVKNARKHVKSNYSWDIVANKFSEVYNKFE
jgi:glycosyltransferase involved in cell wall biosynthesis